jgi:L-ascorbate metabolism protein UlaG (beta-lactamase superfamily)
MSATGATQVRWLGHATFEFTLSSGAVVLLDPWLHGNPACRPEDRELRRVDLMLVTHAHGDHVGDLVRLARTHEARVVCIYDLVPWLVRQGIAASACIGMNKGGTVQPIDGARVSMVPAQHSSSYDDQHGVAQYGGEPVGYVLRFPGTPVIYAAGDTSLTAEMQWIGEYYRPEIGILPIGGHFTMDPPAAAWAARRIGLKTLIPCHYGTFPLLAGTPDELRAEAGNEVRVLAPQPGGVAQ